MATERKYNLILHSTYPVKCLHCGFKGNAKLGRDIIRSLDNSAEEWCPRCGYLALVGENYVPRKRN